MALKPTIYKIRIDLSDLNRDYYDSLNLIVAQHPSETLERMMVRILAFCINASESLIFTKGLSTPEEPDLWENSLDGNIDLWIDVGEPDADRIKKATRVAKTVRVYSFNSKSDTWWTQENALFRELPVEVYQFPWSAIKALSAFAERTMNISVTISGDSAYIATKAGECEVNWIKLSD